MATPDANTTNDYAVATRLTAAYLTDQVRHGKWEALLGGRIERMASRVLSARGSILESRWQAFNPSLHVRYAASANTDQAAHWPEAGKSWVEHAGPLERFLEAVTPRAEGCPRSW